MLDANQMWDVNEAIKWMENLSEFKPLWIEEPTSPDDVLGHANISSALRYQLQVFVEEQNACINLSSTHTQTHLYI